MPRVAAAPVKTEMEVDGTTGENGTTTKSQPDWLNKVKAGAIKKVPKDVQKRRRNYRLGRLLIPKPPMMVLMELIKHDEVTFEKYISDPMSRLLKITATYDGQTFEGVGPTRNIAKNICSEAILQYIAFQACEKDQAGGIVKGSHGEEETPWTALASVALFKMFNDWQAQGANIPPELMKCAARGPVGANPADDVSMADGTEKKVKKNVTKPKADKTLPEDAAGRHPVQLLHEMLGALDYEIASQGAPPNATYHVSVTIDGNNYQGQAKTKKEAKKFAAAQAMTAIYGIQYPTLVKEEKME